MDLPLPILFALIWIIIASTAFEKPTGEVGDDEELVEGSGEVPHTIEFETDNTPTEKPLMDGYSDFANIYIYQNTSVTYHASPVLMIIVCVSVLLSTYLIIVIIVLLCKARKIKPSPDASPEALPEASSEASPETLDSKI